MTEEESQNFNMDKAEEELEKLIDKNKEQIINFYKNNTENTLPGWFRPFLEQTGFIHWVSMAFERHLHEFQNDSHAEVLKEIQKNYQGMMLLSSKILTNHVGMCLLKNKRKE